MKIRELRASDAPRIWEFLKQYFPEEEALMGSRPEGFRRLIHRIFRWDSRFLLGILRVFGRPVFNFYVVEEDSKIVASTLLSYPGPTGYISMVSVDATYRRRGFAQALLEHARETARKRGKSFVALDVLAHNAPAIALYERLGYQRLRGSAFFLREPDGAPTGPADPLPATIRRFESRDVEPLLRIVRERNPPDVERVLPTGRAEILGSRIVERAMEAKIASWVIDRGHGAEGWTSATVSPLTDAANVSAPIVGPSVEPELGVQLVRTATNWCLAQRPSRILSSVTQENQRGRAALEGGGFHEALAAFTLYRSAT
jgi:ribosomal protein S18 acetylase RimI-like enzyme